MKGYEVGEYQEVWEYQEIRGEIIGGRDIPGGCEIPSSVSGRTLQQTREREREKKTRLFYCEVSGP